LIPIARTCIIKTLLESAAVKGHEGVVKLWLEHRSAQPDRHGKFRGTPRSHAAMRAHGGIVKPVFPSAFGAGREEPQLIVSPFGGARTD